MSTDYKKIAEENIKKYGTDIGRYGPVLLAHLYSDRTHFIYEILQNAEDAGARAKKSVKISFHLFKDRLEIRHNGKLFDEPDVRGICGLVEGTKKDDLTQIGKFGIGFKSVYAYTNTPKIYSGDETFCIENYVQPRDIKKVTDIKADVTLFVFPFDHSEVSPEESFNEISKRLREIGAKTLLFLSHTEEIAWNIDGIGSGTYVRDVTHSTKHKKVYVISKVGEQNVEDEEWLIFEKPLQLNATDANLKVEVAFKIQKNKNNKDIIVPAKDSKLIVFFPTKKPTYLNFLIQGPYRTTPTREDIPSDNKQNEIIIKETAELVAQSISVIKGLGHLDTNFLNALPLESKYCENEPNYNHIFQKVKEIFLGDEELLPTYDGKFAKAKDVLLARGKELADLFDGDDINFLFSKKCWADTDITETGRTRELWDYLKKELQVKEVEYQDFAKMITAGFFARKNDNWMIDFYNSLLGQSSLWEEKTHSHKGGILRTKPIIRLENDSHIAPFNELGDNQTYLPTEYKSEYPTVKRVFFENEGTLEFLKKLGLRRPDTFDEIIKFTLPKYHKEQEVDDEEYFYDFAKVLTFFNEADSKIKQEELVSKILETPFILSSKCEFKKPTEIYLNSPELKQYFDRYESASFVSEKLHARFTNNGIVDFLKKLEVADSPRRIPIHGNLSYTEKERLRGHAEYISDSCQRDFDYEGLDLILNQITPDKSVLLWSLLLGGIEALNRHDASGFFQGKYEWNGHFGRLREASFNSRFLNQLRKTQWLINKEDNWKSPSEITFSELPDEYRKEAPNVEVIREKLRFKPDVFDLLPEDAKYKLKLSEGFSPEELKEALALFDKKRESKPDDTEQGGWVPECEPWGTNVKIEDISPVPIEPPQLEDQVGTLTEGKEVKNDGGLEKKGSEEKDQLSPAQKKAIGKWGEECVFKAVRKRFEGNGKIEDTDFGFRVDEDGELIEVFWLNMKSEKGVGYDFVIKMNNEEKEYIEVKSKLEENPELVEITETQFEFARKLNDEGKGERYWIYTVVNAGKSEARIKRFNNPIKLWKDGKLRAHPVHFWL